MVNDLEIYDYNNLNDKDKFKIDTIENTKKKILNEQIILDYISEKKIPVSLKIFYKELLTDFVDFLKERVEYYKTDEIIDDIDKYIGNNSAVN